MARYVSSETAGPFSLRREMRHKLLRFGSGFKVAISNKRSQAAQMTLAPGAVEGGPDNWHSGADQWLYVAAGVGTAIINGKRRALRAGSLLLIERGDRHEIRNTGKAPLKTLNIYIPPAYTASGDELSAGRK